MPVAEIKVRAVSVEFGCAGARAMTQSRFECDFWTDARASLVFLVATKDGA
jgi:hypothetical protein